jgi:hypothetical protein
MRPRRMKAGDEARLPRAHTGGGHGWASTLEMVGAMFAPAVALLPLLWLGVIAGDPPLVLEHLAMLPLMFLVMLRRRAENGGATHG